MRPRSGRFADHHQHIRRHVRDRRRGASAVRVPRDFAGDDAGRSRHYTRGRCIAAATAHRRDAESVNPPASRFAGMGSASGGGATCCAAAPTERRRDDASSSEIPRRKTRHGENRQTRAVAASSGTAPTPAQAGCRVVRACHLGMVERIEFRSHARGRGRARRKRQWQRRCRQRAGNDRLLCRR